MLPDSYQTSEQVVGILLAAGQSSRFGSDKMLYRLPESGRFMVEQSATALLQAMSRCVTVVRPEAIRVKQILDAIGMPWVENQQALSGMSSSLQCGMDYHRRADSVGAWLFALADMPYVSTATIQRVIAKMEHGTLIAAPRFNGRRGHPVAFANRLTMELLNLRGDAGAKSLISQYREQLCCIDVEDKNIVMDIDTPFGMAASV